MKIKFFVSSLEKSTAHGAGFASLTLLLLLGACGGGGSSATGTVTSVTSPSAPMYSQKSVFVISGTGLANAAKLTSPGCTGISVATQTNTSIEFICTPVSLSPTFTLTNPSGQVMGTVTGSVPVPVVEITTSMGNIDVQLTPVQTPITVQNFLAYVNSGFYSQTIFHRVVADSIAVEGDTLAIDQGGGYTAIDSSGNLTAQTGTLLAPIALETNVGLSNVAGTIAMARTSDPNSATSQFYFNALDNSSYLDYQSPASPGYAVFGTVTSGMAVVTAINGVATQTVGTTANVPVTTITIQSAVQIQ